MSISDELDEEATKEQLRAALVRTQKKLVDAKAKTDELVEAVVTAARDAVFAQGPIRPTPMPKFKHREGEPEVALWDTGDWQYSKVTSTFNSAVAQKRVHLFVEKAQGFTELHRRSVPVHDGVVVFGGDMIEGLFQFPSQPFEVDSPLFKQWIDVGYLLADVVRSALRTYERVQVVAEWGNHGRIGSKRQVVPRSDNFDRMAFALAREILAREDTSRLTWKDSPDDVQRLVVGNYRALVLHGDEVGRNGYAAPATIVQHMNRWRSGAFRVNGKAWRFRDVYMHHYHTHAEWPLANGEGSVYQTGSIESDNGYAGTMLAAQAIPSQRVHFIDPKRGRVTAQYKVWLDD